MTDVTQEAPADVGQAPSQTGEVANWTDGFSDDLKGYVETKGFKDAGAIVDSYRNLEKLRGVPEERLLTLPSDQSDAEAMADVYSRLGRPDAADAYKNVLGDGFDDGTYKAIAEQAHKLGLSDGQFQGLQQIVQEQGTAVQQAEQDASEAAFAEWKGANEDGYQNAARVMATVGMDEAAIEGVLSGNKTAIYDMLAKVGSRSAEGKVVVGEQPMTEGFGMSPQAAKQKIASLLMDKAFTDQYSSPNINIRQPAIDRMLKLQELAGKG